MPSTKGAMRFSLVAILLASSGAFAVKVPTGTEDLTLHMSVSLQARAQGAWDGDRPTATGGAAPNGTFDSDFYVRRAQLTTSGIAYKYVTFSIQLDTPNFGIRGNYGGSTFVQDLRVGFQPAKDVDIEMGFLYMPLSHLALQSSSSTSAIEKASTILFYNNDRGLRETGAQIRALLFDRLILIHGGLYEGLHGNPNTSLVVNPSGRPLVAGMLRLNLVGDEAGYYYPSIYLDGKSRVSIGVGGQFQTKGSNTPVSTIDPVTGVKTTVNSAVNDYVALAADVFVDLALPGDSELALQADIYRFDWGAGSDKTGFGSTLEIGYRRGQFEPEVNGYWFNSDSRQNSFLKMAAGLNYFLKGHQAKLSAEVWSIKSGVNLDVAKALHAIVVQAQTAF